MSAAPLRDIRGTAAFYAWNQVNRMDSMPVKEQEEEMARQFWGNKESDTASILTKLLNGDEAFCNMYEELFTTEDENHRILKKQCHGGADLYRAGHHFTSDLLSLSAFTKHDSGNVTGKTLMATGKLMLQNTKKAMAKMRYLKGKVVHLNPRGEIIAYASGMNETDVMRMINDGIYGPC